MFVIFDLDLLYNIKEKHILLLFLQHTPYAMHQFAQTI